MNRFALPLVFALICPAALAAPAEETTAGQTTAGQTTAGQTTAGQASSRATAADPMAGLSMDEQMAVCERIDEAKKAGRTLTPKMQAQEAACRSMMGSEEAAPEATREL